MRTLAKPPKPKSVSQPKKDGEGKKKDSKPVSKKVVKTVFHSPFRYKIQTLSLQDGQQVCGILTNFAKKVRSELLIPDKKVTNEKIIRFESKVTHQKPPIICEYLTYGIKQSIKAIKEGKSSLIVLFYEQNLHDKFEEIMCNIIYQKCAYLMLRQNKNLTAQLGVKKILALSLSHEQLENTLLKFCSKCLIQIPWLVDHTWQPIQKKK